MRAFVLVAAPHPDRQLDVAARPGRELARMRDEVAGDQREEVRGLRVRVLPSRPMPPAGKIARTGGVAVGEEDRVARLVGVDSHSVAGGNIRPVDEIGDPTKPFGLALGAKVAAGFVKAAERRVVLRLDPHLGFEREHVGHVGDDQRAVLVDAIGSSRRRRALGRRASAHRRRGAAVRLCPSCCGEPTAGPRPASLLRRARRSARLYR